MRREYVTKRSGESTSEDILQEVEAFRAEVRKTLLDIVKRLERIEHEQSKLNDHLQGQSEY